MGKSQFEPIFDARAWHGQAFGAERSTWEYHLTPNDISELSKAADHFLSLGKDLGGITLDDFPLEQFQSHLSALSNTLLKGHGFEVLKGLPIDKFSKTKTAAIFCGIGAHLGSARSQNASGHILGHVRDTGASSKDVNTRIYQTAERQTFHTDSADVVGLLCLQNAREGGDSLLVSAVTIYNEMLRQRPDLLPYLFDPIATDRRGEIPDGQKPFMEIAPLTWHENDLTVFYQRQYIDSAQRFEDAFKLTKEHIAALDLFDALANDPDLHLRMRLEPGDMQFVYNHSFLHDRTGFIDYPEPDRKRHLYRLWLSMPNDRELPPSFAQRYGDLTIGDRGGIITQQTKLNAPVL